MGDELYRLATDCMAGSASAKGGNILAASGAAGEPPPRGQSGGRQSIDSLRSQSASNLDG